MKNILIIILIAISVRAEKIKYPYEAFLDLEENEPAIQAFKVPGLHWSTCRKIIDKKGVESCADSVELWSE